MPESVAAVDQQVVDLAVVAEANYAMRVYSSASGGRYAPHLPRLLSIFV